ncbi:membrane protein insertase YidC [Lewinella sp. IMCC34183]|uniref:membrane protein insertase YidC n=1 Tax=Lewinella sp. IMCC34183 TaxID=2248762 RepID=UPI000E26E5F4|nr:membrane protein insertase YidC [Lewinella sp. IMCC34183]
MEMDRTSIIGIVLIMLLFVAWQYVAAPSPAEIEMEQRYQDSIAALSETELRAGDDLLPQDAPDNDASLTDSARVAQYGGRFGAFAAAATGTAEDVVLENNVMRVTLSTKGGTIRQAELKNYDKVVEQDDDEEVHLPLLLLEDERNKFEYTLPVNGVSGEGVKTSDLYFTPTVEGNTVILRAPISGGSGYFEQKYTLPDDTYLIDYDVRFEGLNTVLANTEGTVRLHWENHLDKIERNSDYESRYSTLYYKPVDDDTDYCSCTSDDTEELQGQSLKWVAGSQQFFTSALIADDRFSGGVLTTVADRDRLPDDQLKVLISDLQLPVGTSPSETFGMSLYVGPNEFERLRAIGYDLSDVISFGSSIFGSINRWIIRPVFNFLSSFIGNMGIAILVLTLLVKLLVYPLTYKMLVSQSKMQVLKPEIDKLKAKHKDDAQAAQMETMKLYQEYGASPLGGCLPMVLQMPIWFALYRFFPASISFRQENFLWANDLSTYDSILRLPEWIPFMQGHLSLFAVLWAVTTVIYAFYNSQHMDYSAQPMMKYFQYIMPLAFLGFFNSFAAGLTCYLFFSNVINITQTLVTKNLIIDQDKLRAKLEENKKKPKKKSGFSARLQEALKEQQRAQAAAQSKKGK